MDRHEQQLIQGLKDGEDAAYVLLISLHGGRLLAVARRLLAVARRLVGDNHAPDVLQEAFVLIFQKIETFRGEAKLASWMHRIVVNACLMHLRQTQSRAETRIDDYLPRFDETGHRIDPGVRWPARPDDIVELAELHSEIRRCVTCLPESYRAVFVLRDVEEFNNAEVAQMLGISQNAVKIRLHRARQSLRGMLDATIKETLQ